MSSYLMQARLFDIPTFKDERGSLSTFIPGEAFPFSIARTYWIYGSPSNVSRGNHAHKRQQNVLIAIQGRIQVTLEDKKGEKVVFELNSPAMALHIPSGHWLTISFENEAAILLCHASALHDPEDYIRDYEQFKDA